MSVSFCNWDSSYCESFPILFDSAAEFLDELEYTWIGVTDKNNAIKLKHAKDYQYWEYNSGRKVPPPERTDLLDHVLVGGNKIPLNLITDQEIAP